VPPQGWSTVVKISDGTLRLRRELDGSLQPRHWPDSVVARTLLPADAPAIHRLLETAYAHGGGGVAGFATWWEALRADDEFDPSLCFLAVDDDGLLGVAQCWTSGFIKDLAVQLDARRRGIGENLLRHVFGVFRDRGATHVDLKVDAGNLTARRLYERAGMRPAPLEQ
jgi:ribosomal protein S18 acetylase RimI-like enzyme